jgi:membrane-bound metal-dependent hydrolase YbcI (DUF457 family)
MYAGHFAAGLALKTIEPRAPTSGLMIGVGLLDLVFGVLVAARIEGGGFSHFNTPWSHSLVMSLLWSFLFAAFYWRLSFRVAVAMFAAVMSHWGLDLVSHDADMELWPNSAVALGYGPLFGGLGGWLELVVTLAGLGAYIVWARRPDNRPRRWRVVVVAMVIMYALEVAVVAGSRA